MDIVTEQLSDPHALAVQNCPWDETINLLVKHFVIYTSRNWNAKVGLTYHKKSCSCWV